jgi:peptidoglycan hydrolase-like protein with peptidoglycan-binding domain
MAAKEIKVDIKEFYEKMALAVAWQRKNKTLPNAKLTNLTDAKQSWTEPNTPRGWINAHTRINTFLAENKKFPEWAMIQALEETTPPTPTPSPPTPAPTPPAEEVPYLWRGKAHLSNFMVQGYLKIHGYYSDYPEDGDYGEITESEVARFQKDHNLPITGKVGCLTWNVLVYPPCPFEGTPTPPGGRVFYETSWIDYDQTTNYTCGPSSSYMALSALGVPNLAEFHLASHEGTQPVVGTDHEGIMNGCVAHAAEQGIQVRAYEKTYQGIFGYEGLGQTIADPNKAVIAHGNTAGWPSYYTGVYGHYVFPVCVNLDTERIQIADPARDPNPVYSFSEFKDGLDLVSQPSFIVLEKI